MVTGLKQGGAVFLKIKSPQGALKAWLIATYGKGELQKVRVRGKIIGKGEGRKVKVQFTDGVDATVTVDIGTTALGKPSLDDDMYAHCWGDRKRKAIVATCGTTLDGEPHGKKRYRDDGKVGEGGGQAAGSCEEHELASSLSFPFGRERHAREEGSLPISGAMAYWHCKNCSDTTEQKKVMAICGLSTQRASACICKHMVAKFKAFHGL